MIRVIVSIIFMTFFFVKLAFSQTISSVSKQNEDHDRIHSLQQKSSSIVLSDALILVLKKHAVTVGLHESLVLKCATYLKIIYNTNLTNAERVDACKYGILLYDNADRALPLNVFTDMIKKLEPNK
jgi:hypothetical protein